MKTKIFAMVLMLMLLVVAPLTAWAQGFGDSRNGDVLQGLLTIVNMPTNIQTAPNGNRVDMSVTSTRGGSNSGKPLGMYGLGNDLQFRSDYRNLDAQSMVSWAYDLHQFDLSMGGGWENRQFVSYDKLHDFAEHYWDRNDKFRHMASMFRGWWINDALIDGEHVYLEYQQRLGGFGSADFVAYKDAVLSGLLKRQ